MALHQRAALRMRDLKNPIVSLRGSGASEHGKSSGDSSKFFFSAGAQPARQIRPGRRWASLLGKIVRWATARYRASHAAESGNQMDVPCSVLRTPVVWSVIVQVITLCADAWITSTELRLAEPSPYDQGA